MYRSAIARQARFLSTSARFQKSAVESAKDGLKSVDRSVSDTIVKGIETGENAAAKVKESMPSTGEVKGKASELQGEASGKAAELKGEAKGKAEEVKGKM